LGENYVHVHVHTLSMLVHENISDVTQSTCEYVSILIQRVQFSVASIILFTEYILIRDFIKGSVNSLHHLRDY